MYVQRIASLITSIAFLLICTSASAANPRERQDVFSEFFIQGQIDRGNNTLLTDETGDSDENFDFGDAFAFSVGFDFFRFSNWKTRIALGYRRGSVSPKFVSGASVVSIRETFEAYPLDFMMMYDWGTFAIGGGLTYHISPHLDQSVAGGQPPDFDFENAPGLLLQIEAEPIEDVSFGIRYTDIQYDPEDRPGTVTVLVNNQTGERSTKVDADYVSFYVRYSF